MNMATSVLFYSRLLYCNGNTFLWDAQSWGIPWRPVVQMPVEKEREPQLQHCSFWLICHHLMTISGSMNTKVFCLLGGAWDFGILTDPGEGAFATGL